jgi:hypothetical protein
MELIQIGVTRQKTVLDMVQEMAARQLQEIQQLKAAAQNLPPASAPRQPAARCRSAKPTPRKRLALYA